jgi:hypothetical protein
LTSPAALPDDDLSIPNEAELWRRLHPDWIIPAASPGGRRISSQAFQNYPGAMALSVSIAAEVVGGQSAYMQGFSGHGLCSITAGDARAAQQRIVRDSQPDDPAHAHLAGPKSKSVRKQLADHATVLIDPGVTGTGHG